MQRPTGLAGRQEGCLFHQLHPFPLGQADPVPAQAPEAVETLFLFAHVVFPPQVLLLGTTGPGDACRAIRL